MRRRDFIKGIVGSAGVWPVAVRAQQPNRVRRIGVLMTLAEDDPQGQARFAAFVEGLQQLGWRNGGNIRSDVRWTAANLDDIRKYAAELVALAPDVILASTSPSVATLQAATRSLPRLCSRKRLIRSVQGSLIALRDRAAILPGSFRLSGASRRNGWSCSKRSLRLWRVQWLFGIQRLPPARVNSVPYSRWHHC
jgi:hypothetical protein